MAGPPAVRKVPSDGPAKAVTAGEEDYPAIASITRLPIWLVLPRLPDRRADPLRVDAESRFNAT